MRTRNVSRLEHHIPQETPSTADGALCAHHPAVVRDGREKQTLGVVAAVFAVTSM
jgi:hypothetical protein